MFSSNVVVHSNTSKTLHSSANAAASLIRFRNLLLPTSQKVVAPSPSTTLHDPPSKLYMAKQKLHLKVRK